MKLITVDEAIAELAFSAKDLANETGISEAALSKIKNSKQKVTKEIQSKFEQRYPGYQLTTGGKYAKEMKKKAEKDVKVVLEEIDVTKEKYKMKIASLNKTITGLKDDYENLRQQASLGIKLKDGRIEELKRQNEALRAEAQERNAFIKSQDEEIKMLKEKLNLISEVLSK